MKVYEAWKKTLEMLGGEREEALFWGDYYAQETQNYKKILGEKNFVLKGTEAELAGQFNMEPAMFAGFIDGANTSLKEQVEEADNNMYKDKRHFYSSNNIDK